MHRHECNNHNYLWINDPPNFLFPCENQGVTSFLPLLELSDQLFHDFRPEGLGGLASEPELHGGRHCRSESSELLGHLSVVEGSEPRPL
jgi:hypothetical protein